MKIMNLYYYMYNYFFFKEKSGFFKTGLSTILYKIQFIYEFLPSNTNSEIFTVSFL